MIIGCKIISQKYTFVKRLVNIGFIGEVFLFGIKPEIIYKILNQLKSLNLSNLILKH